MRGTFLVTVHTGYLEAPIIPKGLALLVLTGILVSGNLLVVLPSRWCHIWTLGSCHLDGGYRAMLAITESLLSGYSLPVLIQCLPVAPRSSGDLCLIFFMSWDPFESQIVG